MREKFYLSDLHGADWDGLRRDYAPFIPHLNNDRDFAELLAELLGELNASHTGARYRGGSSDGDRTASLGLLYGKRLKDGIEIVEVLEDNPIAVGESRLADGLVLESIDGVTLSPDVNLSRLLNRKAGQFIRIGLRDPLEDERFEERVKPFSRGVENNLKYRRWIEGRRAEVERLSGGRVGYVHVRGMNDSSYRTVQEEVLGRHANKEAVVIDTRFNGGGDLVDDLSIFLSGTAYMDFIAPDGRSIGLEPSRRWTKPSVVIAGEGNYSDAHCFPWAYQTLGIGPVVGMPVPGTCTFVWWEGQQTPGVVFGVPNMGIKGPDGRYLENLQLEPDVLVDNPPHEVAAGRDRQLERAVELVMEQLGG